ncbi:hypothetical protein NLJ89_g21 [Agrocybe chaxingu]|uniref:Uncharacterized protein n=1 Tax=Agrocybe chaxingu TaxID=84603 RepID=A0A9W8N2S5_9AGAR|nr:hypothetical protein NLJ89_g21 [Agrocybe chaxingu]
MPRFLVSVLFSAAFRLSKALPIATLLPAAQEQADHRRDTPMAPWVIKTIVIAFVIFVIAFLAFLFYQECMSLLPHRRSSPAFLTPVVANIAQQAAAVGPSSNARRMWAFFRRISTTSLRFVAPSRSSYEEIGLQEIDRPPRALIRFKIRSPIAGTAPRAI